MATEQACCLAPGWKEVVVVLLRMIVVREMDTNSCFGFGRGASIGFMHLIKLYQIKRTLID